MGSYRRGGWKKRPKPAGAMTGDKSSVPPAEGGKLEADGPADRSPCYPPVSYVCLHRTKRPTLSCSERTGNPPYSRAGWDYGLVRRTVLRLPLP